jgi:hypothetical protein
MPGSKLEKSFWRQYNSRLQVIENKAANFRSFGSAAANDEAVRYRSRLTSSLGRLEQPDELGENHA